MDFIKTLKHSKTFNLFAVIVYLYLFLVMTLLLYDGQQDNNDFQDLQKNEDFQDTRGM